MTNPTSPESMQPISAASPQTPGRVLRISYCIWALISLSILLGMIVTSPSQEIHDERYHMELVRLADKQGLLNALVSKDNPSAAGPLYVVLQRTFSGLTKLSPPHTRYLNFIILIFIILSVWKMLIPNSRYALEASLSIIAIPQLWRTTGLALTELPALLFFTLFLMLFTLSPRPNQKSLDILATSTLAGIALGLSILGRQTYLTAFGAIGFVGVLHREKRIPGAVTILISTLMSVWLFAWWGGITPPSQRFIESNLKPIHVLYAFSYMGVMSFILNPYGYLHLSRKAWLLSIGAAIVVVAIFGESFHTPGQGIITRFVPNTIQPLALFTAKLIFAIIGMMWGGQIAQDTLISLRSSNSLFLNMNTILLSVAPIKIGHLFSSRYTVGACSVECGRQSNFQPSYIHLAILSISTLFGILSLHGQYQAP